MTRVWAPMPRTVRASTLAILLVTGALVARRYEAVILAAPFMVEAIRAALGRPRRRPIARAHVDGTTVGVRLEGARGSATAIVGWPSASTARPGTRGSAGEARAELSTRYQLGSYGAVELGDIVVAVEDAGWRLTTTAPGPHVLRVRPERARRRPTAPRLPHPRGGDGVHPSARPGASGELADLRDYAPGDSLRSVNWRATARTGQLKTTVRDAERAASILVVADLAWSVWGERTSRDLTIEATAETLAWAATRGDDVGVLDLAGRLAPLPMSASPHQIRRLLAAIERLLVRDGGRLRRPQLPPLGAGVSAIVCSPVLDDHVVAAIGRLVARGVRTAVLDTLPGEFGDPTRDPAPPEQQAAHAERRRLRAHTLDELRRRGVAVLPWSPTALGTLGRWWT